MIDCINRCPFVFFVIIINQFYRHFRIGIGIEAISLSLQLLSQLLIILNDTVMNCHYISVITIMRMGIVLRWFPVGSPSGVTNPAGTGNSFPVVCLLYQNSETAFGFYDLNGILPITDRHSGRIISAILQLGQTVQQNRRCLFTSCISNNSTHIITPFIQTI